MSRPDEAAKKELRQTTPKAEPDPATASFDDFREFARWLDEEPAPGDAPGDTGSIERLAREVSRATGQKI